jgi:hypothetical protein
MTLSDRPKPSNDRGAGTSHKFCILGAGSSGLAVAKNFQQWGIAYDCLEREDDVGGNWYFGKPHSSVYRSTRLISSKSLTEYADFPMPDHFPDHPDQDMVWQYLRSYAEHFELYPHIQFDTSVRRLEPAPSSGWDVTLGSGERRRYRGVVIASGHNWDPRWPIHRGRFDGPVLHSSEYKMPDVLTGRRILVVGGGNSGFDIAVESAEHASATFHSMRRHYQLLPRHHRGRPIDACGEWMLRWRLPLWLRRWSAARACRLAWESLGPQQLPSPDHRLFETHPLINSSWPHDVARGSIMVKPDIQRLQGNAVLFADGSREAVEVIVYATGFRISFPFMAKENLEWSDGRPELYLNVFHPARDDIFVAGLIQPDSGQFGLVDCQSQLIAAYVCGLDARQRAARRFQRYKQRHRSAPRSGIRYVDSPRHLLEVEHYGYRRLLERWINRLRRA